MSRRKTSRKKIRKTKKEIEAVITRVPVLTTKEVMDYTKECDKEHLGPIVVDVLFGPDGKTPIRHFYCVRCSSAWYEE